MSPYRLVLAAEIISEAIRSNKNVEGITLYKQKHNISQYADDSTSLTKLHINCPFVINLWKQIEKWLQLNIRNKIKLDDVDKIFGRNSDQLIDKTLISTKIVIYNNRKTGKRHHVNDVKRSLYNQLCLEEYQAK